MAAHRATGRTATGAGRRFVAPEARARRAASDPTPGRHRAIGRADLRRSPRLVPLLASLSVAAGVLLLVPTAQAAAPQSAHPVAQAQLVVSHSRSAPAADAQSGTGLVPLSTDSASSLAVPLPMRAFAGDQARGTVAVRDAPRPARAAPMLTAADSSRPLVAGLLLIFGGGLVFAVSRSRSATGYRGGSHL